MKKILLLLLFLVSILSAVSCSKVEKTEEFDVALASAEATSGEIIFVSNTDIFEDKDVEITVKYGFYTSEYVHEDIIRGYKIVFDNGIEQYIVDFTDGTYDANDFVYIGDYYKGNYTYPKTETVVLPKALFRERHGRINMTVYGTEGDKLAESLLASGNAIYYQILGNTVMISDREPPIKLKHLLDFKYKTNEYGAPILDTDEVNERYAPSFDKAIERKYPVDCLVAWESSTDITFNDNLHMSKNIVIGSRIDDNKIRLCFYTINEETNSAHLTGTVTLNYSGDYSIDYRSENPYINACLYLYLWDDNTILTFGNTDFNISVYTENITAAATIRDNGENARIREEIEAGCSVESEKTVGDYKICAIKNFGKYKIVRLQTENGEVTEVYNNTFWESIEESFVKFFTYTLPRLFKKIFTGEWE